ncbi:lanthionine synthetase C family protein [Nocardiopsis dassonvillei]
MITEATEEFLAHLADRFADPTPSLITPAQCIDTGAAGIALFHAVRARHDPISAERAHAWVRAATADGVDASQRAGAFYGLPALSLLLSLFPDQYTHARATLTRHLNTLAHRRLDAAQARRERQEPLTFAEYDAITGLTGIGAVLLRTDPHGTAMAGILDYLVRLTEPVRVHGEELPGWWVQHDPWHNAVPAWEGGHANLGTAHGVGGVLALLALAHRQGVRVPHQDEAIDRVCSYLDAWRRQDEDGAWWPGWTTPRRSGGKGMEVGKPGGMSWCYGTPGLARAQQLAGLALGDMARCALAERAMAGCLEPSSLDRVDGTGLCHGLAGVVQAAYRMAQDQDRSTRAPDLNTGLTEATQRLFRRTLSGDTALTGLLEGPLGAVMALSTVTGGSSGPSWDACVLLTA